MLITITHGQIVTIKFLTHGQAGFIRGQPFKKTSLIVGEYIKKNYLGPISIPQEEII